MGTSGQQESDSELERLHDGLRSDTGGLGRLLVGLTLERKGRDVTFRACMARALPLFQVANGKSADTHRPDQDWR